MYLYEVYVTNSSLNVNHPFTYFSYDEIDKYKRVRISFNHSYTTALIFNVVETNKSIEEIEKEKGFKLSPILDVIDDETIFSDELFDLALWLSKTTLSPVVSCINAMLPKVLKTSRKIKDPKTLDRIKRLPFNNFKTIKQVEVYQKIIDGMLISDARKLYKSVINKLIEYGALEIYKENARYINQEIEKKSFKTLTDDQEKCYNDLIKTDKLASLLFGVTGSGKTEVYLHLARYYLNLGKEILILVPEISLTPQMIQRVKERFSDVVFYHSELNDQEKFEQYFRIKAGEVKIVVGTRSSIFLPFHNLGLIIVDEEHDQSYKQDSNPTYAVKNVAIKRAIYHHAKVLFASATPSLDSYTRALKNEYQLLKLEHRINLMTPDIEIIDMNDEIKKKGSYIISSKLKDEIENTIKNNKQSIILLNRRGYSPIIKCLDCGKTLMCSDCDIPLNYHKDENILKCHCCGKIYKIPKTCPNCSSNRLTYYGFGTQRVEEELNRLFPNVKTIRMDKDTTGKKGSHKRILDSFEKHEYDVLIGTQMISKGLDYPDVTLVGILNADSGLMHQDYNASKVTFDLLMQASGRSGRANSSGKVIIQAFNRDHYAIKAVLKQDYNYFYNIEMSYRSKAKYPPYSHILTINIEDDNDNRLFNSINFIKDKLKSVELKYYEPVELYRLKRQRRFRIMMLDPSIKKMLDNLNDIVNAYISQKNMSKIKIDIDPLYLE